MIERITSIRWAKIYGWDERYNDFGELTFRQWVVVREELQFMRPGTSEWEPVPTVHVNATPPART